MTNEEAKKAGFRTDANGWATTWRILNTNEIRRLYSKVRGLDANDFPTRAKAREALRKWKLEAEHAKWLADMRSQTTPITPEQAKMLRPDDIKYGYDAATLGVFGIRGGAKEDPTYAKSPLFFTEQAARNRLNEVIAAQAELSKAKAEAEPLEWYERKKGDDIDWSNDEITWDKKGKENWQHPTPFAGLRPKVGDFCDELGSIRARYRNPLWLAKHSKPVESHETPVGETQGKEVVKGETQDPEPMKWAVHDASDTIDCNHVTPEWQAWKARQDAKVSNKEPVAPVYLTKSSTVESTKLSNKSEAVSHPSHYTSHPSGVECITITKHMNFCRGNAVKYLWRAGQKGDTLDKEIEDIAKAGEYCRIEMERLIALKGAK